MAKEKKPFLKEVHSLPVQTRLRHDFGTRTIWARDSPFSSFFFSTGQRLNKEKRSEESTKRFFSPTQLLYS